MGWHFEKLREKIYNRPCPKCGTIIPLDKGYAVCYRCQGVEGSDLIDIHKQQTEERERFNKMGFRFVVMAIFIAVLISVTFLI